MRSTVRFPEAFNPCVTLNNFNDIGRSTLGFQPDRLGLLAERNKYQAEQALHAIRNPRNQIKTEPTLQLNSPKLRVKENDYSSLEAF